MASKSLGAHLFGFLLLLVGVVGVVRYGAGTVQGTLGLGSMVLGALLIGAGFVLAGLEAIEDGRIRRF